MELERDARFRDEESRFKLRWQCEDCGLYDALRGCAHGYPTARHRNATADVSTILFCKDFEIGG
jgi:hypothetical protein